MAEAPLGPEATARRRRGMIFLACAAFAVTMVGAAYAAVPLYKRFCQLTGFNGVVKRGEAPLAADAVAGQPLRVRFDTNVRTLPWTFEAVKTTQDIRVGTANMAYFRVTNRSAKAMTGRASYNVAPEAAGQYLVKTQCFCFNDQTIAPGKTIEFPVVYYIQPGFAKDRDTQGFSEITLSYTFFPSPDATQPGRAG